MSETRGEDLAAARALFFAHDGSRFYMSRDDVQAEFDAHRVPEETTVRWLRELVDLRLSELGGERGWWAVHSLLGHRELAHLSAVVAQVPVLGKPWQRRAYVEEALTYWDACAGWDPASGRASGPSTYDREVLVDAVRWILDRSGELLDSYRMRGQRTRLQKVVEAAQARLDAVSSPDRPPRT